MRVGAHVERLALNKSCRFKQIVLIESFILPVIYWKSVICFVISLYQCERKCSRLRVIKLKTFVFDWVDKARWQEVVLLRFLHLPVNEIAHESLLAAGLCADLLTLDDGLIRKLAADMLGEHFALVIGICILKNYGLMGLIGENAFKVTFDVGLGFPKLWTLSFDSGVELKLAVLNLW